MGLTMLFKNVLRTLKKQWIQLILLGLIIALSSFGYVSMDYSIGGILAPSEQYFVDNNQEDFAIDMLNFLLPVDQTTIASSCTIDLSQVPPTLSALRSVDLSCYNAVQAHRLSVIESKYPNINLEIRDYKDIYFTFGTDSYKIRVLKATHDINLSYFVKGGTPQNDNEIAVSDTFAKNNNLDIGSTFDINGKVYTVSGFVLFPDYSLAVFSSDLILDNKTQTPALMTDNEFNSLPQSDQFAVAGTYDSGYTKAQFKTDVILTYRTDTDLSFITNIVMTANNLRSGGVYADMAGGKAESIGVSMLISLIALMIVGIMVSKILNSQRGPIGLLKSMGYKNSEIAFPYILFIAIMALPAILIGYYLGYLFAEPLKNMILEFYLLPAIAVQQTVKTFVISVIVPFVFIIGLGYVVIVRMLNKKPVELLNPQMASSSNVLTRVAGKYLKHFKITTKLKHLLLYRSSVKFYVYIIGMFFAAFLVLFSFSMNGMYDRMMLNYYNQIEVKSIGYCDITGACEVGANDEKVIDLPSVLLGSEEIEIVGLAPSTELHKLYDHHMRDITNDLSVTNQIVITQSLSLTKGYKVGDTLKLEVGSHSQDVHIIGITEEYGGNKAYMNITSLSTLVNGTTTYYNAVYSKTSLDPNNYMVVINTSDILKQADQMQRFFNVMVVLMIGTSVVIGASVIYILTVMTIEDNFYNISLFKVMGYNNKEIDQMILGGYLGYGIFIFLLLIPISLWAFHAITLFFARYFNMMFPLELKWWQMLISLGIYVSIFYVGAFVAKRHLEKVSLQEAMKLYQI